MTRLMYDSVDPSKLPNSPQMVAGYANGRVSQWPQSAWVAFRGIPHATIDVLGTDHVADVLDVETGDASVSTAVEWVRTKWQGPIIYPPVIYCNRSTLTPLFNAMNAAGFEVVRHFRLWVGTLDGTRALADMTGVTAVQYEDAGEYDVSIVYDDAWMPGIQGHSQPVSVTRGIVVDHDLVTHAVQSTDGGRTWSV